MEKSKNKTSLRNFSFAIIVGFISGGIIAGVLGIIFGSLVEDFIKKAISDLAFATGIMALGTLILAFFTYWSIHSRNAQEKRDRKERLLNEIIEWAEDVATLGHEESIISLPDASEDGVDEYDMIRMILKTLSAIFARCQITITRSIYVEAVAYDISNGLGGVVTQTISKLDALSKRLSTTIKKESKGITKPKGPELVELRQCAQRVIEMATKIKTKDIS